MKHFLGAMLVFVLTAVVVAPNTARSAVIINFAETGGNVTMNLSGSLDLTGAAPGASSPNNPFIIPAIGVISVRDPAGRDAYSGLSGPAGFGTGGLGFASTFSGSGFLIRLDIGTFEVPLGYVSNDPLSSAMTFNGTDFATRGMIVGTYVWTLPSSDTITVNVGVASVPAPAGLPLALAGLGAVVLIRRQRKHRA